MKLSKDQVMLLLAEAYDAGVGGYAEMKQSCIDKIWNRYESKSFVEDKTEEEYFKAKSQYLPPVYVSENNKWQSEIINRIPPVAPSTTFVDRSHAMAQYNDEVLIAPDVPLPTTSEVDLPIVNSTLSEEGHLRLRNMAEEFEDMLLNRNNKQGFNRGEINQIISHR